MAKLTALTEITAASPNDILYIVHNPGTTPVQKKIAVNNLINTIDVKQYGAIGDGVTNDSAAIQAAIDACAAAQGGIVYFPIGDYKCNITLAASVFLVGTLLGTKHGFYGGSGKYQSQLHANAGGPVIDTPVGSTVCCGVVGLNIYGLGAATAGNGIRFRNVTYGVISNVHISNFADEGILVNAGVACTFEDILIMGCLLDITRASRAGAFDIDGSDHYISRVETTANLPSGKSDANLYVCATVIRGSTCMVHALIGELSDMGIVVMGSENMFTGCRADLNWAHGWYVAAGYNMFSSCLALNNSQDATNTYSGFCVVNTGVQGCTYVGCLSNTVTVSNVQKYGFYDPSEYDGAVYKNNYIGCNGVGNGTSTFKTESYAGVNMSFATHQTRATANDATPSVDGVSLLSLGAYTLATDITDFDDAVAGHSLFVLGNANVTIKNNANIYTNTGADKTLSAKIYHFINWSGVWYEAE
jgi:hypothetical protein